MDLWRWTGAICVLLVIVGIAEHTLGLPAFMVLSRQMQRHVISDYSNKTGLNWDEAKSAICAECSGGTELRSLLKLMDEYNYIKFTKKVLPSTP